MKRLLSLVLLLSLLLVSVLVSCDTPTQNGGDETESTTNQTGEDSVKDLYATLPEKTYGGADFCLLHARHDAIEGTMGDAFESDSEASTAVSAAIYLRNRDIEDRFDVTITHYSSVTPYEDVAGTTASGDLVYHNIYANYAVMSNLSTGEYLTNLQEVPHIDFDQTWWNSSAQENFVINDKQFLAINDTNYVTMVASHCMYFNKNLYQDHKEHLENPYDLVKSGDWTIETVMRLSKVVGQDNGDSVWNEEDIYGVSLSCGYLTMCGVSFGENVYPINIQNGEIVDTDENKWNNIVNHLYTLCYDNDNHTFMDPYDNTMPMSVFVNGNAFLYFGNFCEAPLYFRDMEDDYGILPYPKYDTEQTAYYTSLSGGSMLLGISTLPSETEMDYIGLITEALAIKSNDVLRTAVYETVFENQLTRDEESKEMLEIIIDGLYADFVFIHASGPDGYYGEIHMLLGIGQNNYTSMRNRNKKRLEAFYQGILDLYNNLD